MNLYVLPSLDKMLSQLHPFIMHYFFLPLLCQLRAQRILVLFLWIPYVYLLISPSSTVFSPSQCATMLASLAIFYHHMLMVLLNLLTTCLPPPTALLYKTFCPLAHIPVLFTLLLQELTFISISHTLVKFEMLLYSIFSPSHLNSFITIKPRHVRGAYLPLSTNSTLGGFL